MGQDLFLLNLYVNWMTCHFQLHSVSATDNNGENVNSKKFGPKEKLPLKDI